MVEAGGGIRGEAHGEAQAGRMSLEPMGQHMMEYGIEHVVGTHMLGTCVEHIHDGAKLSTALASVYMKGFNSFQPSGQRPSEGVAMFSISGALLSLPELLGSTTQCPSYTPLFQAGTL